MRLRAFEYLIEINNCKSMLIASNNLHITPQALGNSIKKLEDYYGCQLLVRTPTGSHLSEKGIELVNICTPFLEKINKFMSNNCCDGKPNKIENYYVPTASGCLEHVLAYITTAIQLDFPNISFDFAIYSFLDALEKLKSHEIDLYLNYYYKNSVLPNEIVFTPLKTYKLCCFMHDKFKHSSQKSISLKDIIKYPQIFYKTSFTQQKEIFGNLNSKIYIADNLSIYREWVKNGLGVTVGTPQLFMSSEFKKIHMLDIVEPVYSEFGYLSLSGNSLERYQQLIELFKRYL